MAGTGYQSADLLTRFNQETGRPATGDSILDATKYQYLADGQAEYIGDLVAVTVKPFITGPVDITANTTDGGKTFTFGTDADGYPLFALGTKIFPALNAVPDWPLIPGSDYLDEGIQIRMPNNMISPFPAIIWYGAAFPQRMSASVQPSITLPAARLPIVYKAAANFALTANVRQPELAAAMEGKYQKEFGKWITVLRKHFMGGGALAPLVTPFGSAAAFSGNVPW